MTDFCDLNFGTCPYCKKMYKNTFSNEELGIFLSDNFILIKINNAKDSLDSEYGIEFVPTTVFTDSYGNEIEDMRMIGAKSVDYLRNRAEEALAVWSEP